MNIQSILAGFEPGAAAAPKNDPVSGAGSPTDASAASAPINNSFREILAKYDVRNISPREFSELVQKLADAGQISRADVQELSQLRLELDSSQPDADQPFDLLKFLQEKLRKQDDEINRQNRRRPDQPVDRDAALQVTRHQLQWVEKFASVQSGRFSDALDQVI